MPKTDSRTDTGISKKHNACSHTGISRRMRHRQNRAGKAYAADRSPMAAMRPMIVLKNGKRYAMLAAKAIPITLVISQSMRCRRGDLLTVELLLAVKSRIKSVHTLRSIWYAMMQCAKSPMFMTDVQMSSGRTLVIGLLWSKSSPIFQYPTPPKMR